MPIYEKAQTKLIIPCLGLFSAYSMGCEGLILPWRCIQAFGSRPLRSLRFLSLAYTPDGLPIFLHAVLTGDKGNYTMLFRICQELSSNNIITNTHSLLNILYLSISCQKFSCVTCTVKTPSLGVV